MSSTTRALDDAVRSYLLRTGVRDSDVKRRLREATAAMPNGGMQISPEQGQLMALLVEMLGARRALEVGTFTGYSALCVAEALPPDGTLVACDVSEEWTAMAQRYWAEAGVAGRIELRIGPALDTLDDLIAGGAAASFDFAFIDADKGNYLHYYERCLELLRPGGVLGVDNTLWGGRVVDTTDRRDSTVAIRALNDRMATDERITPALLPVGDGLFLARKR